MSDPALPGRRRGPLRNVWRRIQLTYRYLGWRTLAFRVLTFPLRFTPLGRRLRLRSGNGLDVSPSKSSTTKSMRTACASGSPPDWTQSNSARRWRR